MKGLVNPDWWAAQFPNFPLDGGDILASRDTGELYPWPALLVCMERVQKVREAVGHPIRVNCLYRTVAHNAAVGGWMYSDHLFPTRQGERHRSWSPGGIGNAAIDVSLVGWAGHDREEALRYCLRVGEWPRARMYETFAHLTAYGPREVQVDDGLELPSWAREWR